jgi:hypothetical protein
MTLIATLRAQHAAVLTLVQDIEACIEKGDTKQLHVQLKALGGALTAHLALEDAQLYPGLEKLAATKGSENLRTVASQFSINMGRISQSLLSFLRKYDAAVTDLTSFRRDWSQVKAALASRISAEETSLYPLFEKATKAAEAAASAT